MISTHEITPSPPDTVIRFSKYPHFIIVFLSKIENELEKHYVYMPDILLFQEQFREAQNLSA